MTTYGIDQTHSNSYTAWKKMGSPQQPTSEQIRALEKAGQLQQIGKEKKLKAKNGNLTVSVNLPRQAVYLLRFSWK